MKEAVKAYSVPIKAVVRGCVRVLSVPLSAQLQPVIACACSECAVNGHSETVPYNCYYYLLQKLLLLFIIMLLLFIYMLYNVFFISLQIYVPIIFFLKKKHKLKIYWPKNYSFGQIITHKFLSIYPREKPRTPTDSATFFLLE